jgi:hypothetical protein
LRRFRKPPPRIADDHHAAVKKNHFQNDGSNAV